MKKLLLILCIALLGCEPKLTVDANLDIGINDDECLTCFPECDEAGAYTCVRPDGALCDGCIVTCFGGAELTCVEPDPECWQYLQTKVRVPTICVSKEF